MKNQWLELGKKRRIYAKYHVCLYTVITKFGLKMGSAISDKTYFDQRVLEPKVTWTMVTDVMVHGCGIFKDGQIIKHLAVSAFGPVLLKKGDKLEVNFGKATLGLS